jgi:glycosyltransferase involved in cell wall biosynthesis
MLSVIITTFQQSKSLAALLCCLRAQDIDLPFEVIICDDGSSLATLKAVKNNAFFRMDIRYIWQPNHRSRAARSKNNGIRCARGDILVFVDGDIVVDSDFLRKHLEAHHSQNLIVCNPRRWVIDTAISKFHKESGAKPRPDFLIAAGDEISSPFKQMLEDSIEVDRDYQIRMYKTDPWFSCIGFSFSVERHPAVYFDEAFEGWGPEDRELAFRLVKRHGFSVSYCNEIEVLHLETCSTGRTPFTLLPRTHSQITSYMRNMIYLRNLYPDEDLSVLMKPLLAYRLNPATQQWELRSDAYSIGDTQRSNGRASSLPHQLLPEMLDSIEQWLKTHPTWNGQ